jgi:membrane-associated phospholipid phosphatase
MRTRIGSARPLLGALLALLLATRAARGQDTVVPANSSGASQAQGAPAGTSGNPIEYPKRPGLVAQTLGDIEAYYTAPLHWNSRDWEYFGGALAAIAVAHRYDAQVRTHFDSGASSPLGPKSSGTFTDALPAAIASLGTLGYATLIHSPAGHTEAWNMLESSGLSFVTAFSLSYAFGRQLPDATTNPNRWFHGAGSFPSEHAAVAFAVGTVLAESGNPQYRWIRRVLGYGVGIGTAYLRMKHNAHWLSDTVAGAALGMATAHFVMDRSDQRQAKYSDFSLVPVPGGVMLAFSMTLPQ